MATRNPVTGETLRLAAKTSHEVLHPLIDLDWSQKAYRLSWTCRYTLDHVLNCLVWYAHDLAGEVTGMVGSGRGKTPRASVGDLLDSLQPFAEVLALVGTGMPESARGWHDWGFADAEGFLAMGSVETSLHTWDIVMALAPERVDQAIAPAVAEVLVPRLFPDAPAGFDPVPTLLYATGRGDLDGLPRIKRWQWHSDPV